MPVTFYKLLHVVGALMAFSAIGSAIAARGSDISRKHHGIVHGVGMLFLLVAGFGMLAKLDYGFPMWVFGKILVWLIVGGLPFWIRKSPASGGVFWPVLAALGVAAVGLALYKPF